MLRPSDREMQAIKGLYGASPSFFAEFVSYLENIRDAERQTMEVCASEFNDIQKGKCQMLSEEIRLLKSLIPKSGD